VVAIVVLYIRHRRKDRAQYEGPSEEPSTTEAGP
jgi:hypothetical protein